MLKTPAQLGQTIKSLRKEKGYTQEELANKLSISFQAVSKWENGESYPDISLIELISCLFDVSLDYLLKSNESSNNKKTFRVYEKFESNNGCLEVDEITIINETIINLSIQNHTNKSVILKPENFILIDDQGKNVQPVIDNLSNYDYETVKSIYRHNIPSIIPPSSLIKVELVYSRLSVNANLWINIQELMVNISFYIHSKNHTIQQTNTLWQYDEIIDFYSFKIKKNSLPIYGSNYPLIDDKIADKIHYPSVSTFFNKYHYIFTDEAKLLLAKTHPNVDMDFVKSHIRDVDTLRSTFKRNLEKIEADCKNGHCSYLSINKPEPFMDNEIIYFLLRISLTYFKILKEWMFTYVNDDFLKQNQNLFENLPFKTLISLFDTNLSSDIVNDMLEHTEPIEEYFTLKLINHYSKKIKSTTKDAILVKLPVDSLEVLERLKPHLSKEAFESMKDKYFQNESLKLEKAIKSL